MRRTWEALFKDEPQVQHGVTLLRDEPQGAWRRAHEDELAYGAEARS